LPTPLEDRIVLCEARTGEVIRRWNDSGKQSPMGEQLAFSPDGKLLASSDSNTIHLWEVATGKEVNKFQGHRGDVRFLAFSDNGRRLASASIDSTVLLWDLPLGVRSGAASVDKPGEKEIAAWWGNLASEDASRAYAAVWRLAETPGPSVAFLGQHLRPLTDAELKQVHRHIEESTARTPE
jgi:WD40 repeat protein